MTFFILQDYILIKQKIEELFSHDTRNQKRAMFVNYLDESILKILPDVYDVNIFCYPQPGNIDPYALEDLHGKGAKIYFTDPINTNLFYVENKGIIIGSANFNYTKNVLECFDKFPDILVFINDWSIINIDIMINSFDKKLINKNDLEIFKEKHHIFWRTYDGFEELVNSMVNTSKCIDIIEDNMRSYNNITNILKYVGKLFSFSKSKKLLKKTGKETLLLDPKFVIKNAGENIIDKKNMSIYCVSKEDLFELLLKQLTRKKKDIKKRNLH